MSLQGHLFDNPISAGIEKSLSSPIARKADPEPSKSAARQITESGRREGQLMGVLALVKQYPRSTSLELSRKSNFDRYTIARRLPELEESGLVRKCSVRQCSVGNRPATTWEAY